MKDKNFDLIISITLYYVISNFAMLIIAYTLFKLLGLSQEVFFSISLVLIFLSIFIGYFLAKLALSPFVNRNRFLDKLLKDTLHELNIPIATILANVKLIQKNEIDEKKLKRLDRIELACKKLLKLYSELDYFIKKEIKEVDTQIFNLKDVILEEIENFTDVKKEIKIYTDLKDTTITSNKSGFIKVIDNLISNAIKYNRPKGLIFISLKDNKLIVEDSGIGLNQEEILKIFERYYQSNLNSSGYGIGLNIVKSFCDEYKIKIKIESKKEIGTKFILDLSEICLN